MLSSCLNGTLHYVSLQNIKAQHFTNKWNLIIFQSHFNKFSVLPDSLRYSFVLVSNYLVSICKEHMSWNENPYIFQVIIQTKRVIHDIWRVVMPSGHCSYLNRPGTQFPWRIFHSLIFWFFLVFSLVQFFFSLQWKSHVIRLSVTQVLSQRRHIKVWLRYSTYHRCFVLKICRKTSLDLFGRTLSVPLLRA